LEVKGFAESIDLSAYIVFVKVEAKWTIHTFFIVKLRAIRVSSFSLLDKAAAVSKCPAIEAAQTVAICLVERFAVGVNLSANPLVHIVVSWAFNTDRIVVRCTARQRWRSGLDNTRIIDIRKSLVAFGAKKGSIIEGFAERINCCTGAVEEIVPTRTFVADSVTVICTVGIFRVGVGDTNDFEEYVAIVAASAGSCGGIVAIA